VPAPGFGPLGFGIALLAVGTVMVAKGNEIAAAVLDLLGIVFIWSAFRVRRD
jgi:hypothetical protein